MRELKAMGLALWAKYKARAGKLPVCYTCCVYVDVARMYGLCLATSRSGTLTLPAFRPHCLVTPQPSLR